MVNKKNWKPDFKCTRYLDSDVIFKYGASFYWINSCSVGDLPKSDLNYSLKQWVYTELIVKSSL